MLHFNYVTLKYMQQFCTTLLTQKTTITTLTRSTSRSKPPPIFPQLDISSFLFFLVLELWKCANLHTRGRTTIYPALPVSLLYVSTTPQIRDSSIIQKCGDGSSKCNYNKIGYRQNCYRSISPNNLRLEKHEWNEQPPS